MNVREIFLEGVDRIQVAQDGNYLPAVVSNVITFWVP
jgi:hypothetical protein